MRRDHRHTEHAPVDRAPGVPAERDRAGWQGLVLLAIGWSGVAVAHATPAVYSDANGAVAFFSTTGLGAISLVAIAGGAAIAVTAALSPTRHVFRSRPAFLAASMLFAVAAVAIASLILQAPLDDIAAHGKPLEELTADLVWVAASLICLVGWGAALERAWQARRDERSWQQSLT